MTSKEIIQKIKSLPNPHTSNHAVWGVHMKNYIWQQNENLSREQVYQDLNKEQLIVIYSLILLRDCLILQKIKGKQFFIPNSGIRHELIYGLLKEINEIISE